jgi:septal ring factor EnvC (AmiA/AmiB activator)
MMALICSIFTLVLGFCIGSTRYTANDEVKRLTHTFWELKGEVDESNEALSALKRELTKVKLECAKLKKQISDVG